MGLDMYLMKKASNKEYTELIYWRRQIRYLTGSTETVQTMCLKTVYLCR